MRSTEGRQRFITGYHADGNLRRTWPPNCRHPSGTKTMNQSPRKGIASVGQQMLARQDHHDEVHRSWGLVHPNCSGSHLPVRLSLALGWYQWHLLPLRDGCSCQLWTRGDGSTACCHSLHQQQSHGEGEVHCKAIPWGRQLDPVSCKWSTTTFHSSNSLVFFLRIQSSTFLGSSCASWHCTSSWTRRRWATEKSSTAVW